MPKQINLINAAYRQTRHRLNSVTMLAGAGAVYACVAAWNYSEQFTKRGLDGRRAEIDQRLLQTKAGVEKTTAAAKNIEPDQRLTAEIAALELRLRVQREVLTALETGGLGSTDGFSRYLTALARQRLEGVWLTKVTLSADNELAIGGRLTSAELLPIYIRLLNKEEALRGRRFGELKLVAQKEVAAAIPAVTTPDRAFPGAARSPTPSAAMAPPAADASYVEFELGAVPKAN